MKNNENIFPFDFVVLLNSELKRRMTQNDRYSLRAYARDLGVDPSDLSKILSGKRRLGEKLTKQFAKKLGFSNEALDLNRDLESEHLAHDQLALDNFEIISDWCHFAILELVKLDDFIDSEKYVSNMLKIPKQEVRSAIQRLLRVGLLEQKNETLIDATSGRSTTIHHEYTAPAFKNLQRGILNKAIDAMEETPLSERDQSSITVASSAERIKQAKSMIKKFRRSLSKFLESADNKDTVYNLSISLYPITHSQGDKE